MPLDPQLDPHFDEAARLNNLDPQLLRAMASGESDFDPNATSKKNAGGLMQIIPETAQRYGIKDPYDPVQAIYGAARILNDNLTNAEAAKAAGANIVPVDEALRSYFAGSGGENRGPLTAKYPGYIASKYSELQKGAGVASTPSPIDQLAAARGPMPTPGAVATNVQPPPGTPDTLDAAPTPIAQLAALSGLGTSPSIPDRSAGGMPGRSPQNFPPGTKFNSLGVAYSTAPTGGVPAGTPGAGAPITAADAARMNAGVAPGTQMPVMPSDFVFGRGMVAPPGAGRVSPSDGVDRLANASPTPLAPGLTQVAQAGVPSDADLLKMLDAVAPAKAAGAVSPASSATVPPPLSAPPGQQVNPDAIAESIAKIDRNNILGRPSNPYDVERVKLAPGLSGDPQQQWRLKQAETLAAHSQQIGPAGIEPMPGSLEAEKATEKFKALGHTLGTPGTARQGETTGIYTEPGQTPPLVYHEAFQSPRLPEGAQTQPPPPGSPPGTLPSVTTLPGATPAIQSAATAGIAGKAAIQPKLDAEKVASEDFGELRKAYQGNQGAMQNLQNFLNAAAIVGTGKGTSLSADAAAWLKSINVDPQKLSLADPAEVEKMRKASTQAVFGAIKGVSSRPAFQEFAMLDKAMPNPDLQPEANRSIAASLLGRMNWENNLFSAWDKSRRDTGSHLAFNLPEWVASNPIQGFQSSAYGDVPSIPSRGVVGGGNQPTHQTTGAAPKGLRYDPATKTLVPMQ